MLTGGPKSQAQYESSSNGNLVKFEQFFFSTS
jgi:hypothetical protein